ncbi:TPA: restriction endonuclease subunit S [Staphylococcus aureus]
MEFKKLLLGELCEIKSSKRIYAKDYVKKGIPFYRSKEIIEKSNGSNISQNLYIDNKKFEEIKKKYGVPEKGDLLLTSVGTLGIPYIVGNEKFYFKDGNLTWFNKFNSLLSQEYLFYWFKSKEGISEINRITIGSTQKALTIKNLKELRITLPSKKNQIKITNLIKKIELKIETNQNIIANLEELSQTLFKRWFVDFEFPDEDGNPYRSSGGEMIDSELGEMPKNWKVNKLKEFTKKISSGGTPSRKVKDYWEYGEIMWLKTKEVKEKMIVTTEENITDLGLLKSSAKIINENSTVIAMYGATAGQIAYLGCKMATNQACCTIESEYPNFIYNYFVYSANYIKTLSSGSAQQNLNKKIIEDLKLLVPSLKVLNHYESSVNSNTSLIKSLTLSNLKLQELRDTLLPKLMSGEIEIPDDVEVNTDELSI